MAVSQPKRAIKPFQGFHAIKNDSSHSHSHPTQPPPSPFIIIITTVFDIPISTGRPQRQPLPISFHDTHTPRSPYYHQAYYQAYHLLRTIISTHTYRNQPKGQLTQRTTPNPRPDQVDQHRQGAITNAQLGNTHNKPSLDHPSIHQAGRRESPQRPPITSTFSPAPGYPTIREG